MTESDVVALVRRGVDEHGSQVAFASQVGISPVLVCDVVNGRRPPGPRLLKHLGLTKVKTVQYVPEAAAAGR